MKPQSMETYAKWLYEIQHTGRNLTSWEETFIESLDQQMASGRGISEKQAEILETIFASKSSNVRTTKFSQIEYLVEALVAARDVLASLTNTLGIVPGQNAYSTRMTEPEMVAARAISDLDSIISRHKRPDASGKNSVGTGRTRL